MPIKGRPRLVASQASGTKLFVDDLRRVIKLSQTEPRKTISDTLHKLVYEALVNRRLQAFKRDQRETKFSEQQIAENELKEIKIRLANIAAAKAHRDLEAGGFERGYRQQIQGVNSAYRLNLEANQLNLAGALKAAEVVKLSGLKAVKLEQTSQIVTTLSRDIVRRAEQALTMRY